MFRDFTTVYLEGARESTTYIFPNFILFLFFLPMCLFYFANVIPMGHTFRNTARLWEGTGDWGGKHGVLELPTLVFRHFSGSNPCCPLDSSVTLLKSTNSLGSTHDQLKQNFRGGPGLQHEKKNRKTKQTNLLGDSHVGEQCWKPVRQSDLEQHNEKYI